MRCIPSAANQTRKNPEKMETLISNTKDEKEKTSAEMDATGAEK
jgi:hypothetical protein